MQLLLVAKKQVAAGETSFALGTLEGLLLCVGPFMSFQVLQSSKCAATSGTAMRTRLVGLGGREIGRGRLGVDGDCRSFYLADSQISQVCWDYQGKPRVLGSKGLETKVTRHCTAETVSIPASSP